MRVLHLIKSLGRGGAETLLVEGLRVEQRHHLEYAYLHPLKSELAVDLRSLGASVTLVPGASWNLLERAAHVARLVRRHRIDLIHGHLPIAGVVARLAGKMSETPVVYTEHYVLEKYRPLTRALDVLTWSQQSVVVACSADVARSIAEHIPRSTVPVVVVDNGVSTARFRPEPDLRAATRSALGLTPEQPLIVTVAVFRKQKRLDLWVDAAAHIAARHPSARFAIVGDGPERAAVEAHLRRSGLGERVTLVGHQADPRPWLCAADVYMMSSDGEGLPVALLEAMATGLPVVATAVGGIPGVVDSRSGVLVPAGDAAVLAAGVCSMLERSAEARANAGRSARSIVERDYGIKRMQDALCAIYDEVLMSAGVRS